MPNYGDALSSIITPLGMTPPQAVVAPIKGVQAPLIGAPPGQKTPDQIKYHKQRNDVLAALKHAADLHGELLANNGIGRKPHPADIEAQKKFLELMNIYSKLPGYDREIRTGEGPMEEAITKVGADKVYGYHGVPGYEEGGQ